MNIVSRAAINAALIVSFSCGPSFAQDYFHLYVYNECDSSVSLSTEYVPIGGGTKQISQVDALSGHQVMAAVSDQNSFTLTISGGNYRWNKISIVSALKEYTHAISCNCVGSGCPQNWPSPPSRQYADKPFG